MCCTMAGPKFCRAPNAMIETRKKRKHIQTALEPRKAKVAGFGMFSAGGASCCDAAANALRRAISSASAITATDPAAKAAGRQPTDAAMLVMNTGAAAQPRLPESPCTENAWPNREGVTRLLSTV